MSDMDPKEFTNDLLIADIMLRVTAMEKLLIQKGFFTQNELVSLTEDIAKSVSKVILEKANYSKNIDEFIADLESSSKIDKN